MTQLVALDAPPHIEQTREPMVETRHAWSACAFQATRAAPGEGATPGLAFTALAHWGPPLVTPWRSAAKPFQLAVNLALLGDPELSDAEMAVGAASHSGEPAHLSLVDALLARFGLGPDALRCGRHPPVHTPSAVALHATGRPVTDRHNNCSGKHTFMAAATAARGWDADYRPPDHPLQREMTAAVTRWSGEVPALGIDGCGVPTFGLSLPAIARAWATLAWAMSDDAEADGDAEIRRLARVGWAMARNPHLTSGTGRFDSALAAAATEPLCGKIGAGGVFCVALPHRRIGLAVKIHSGSSEALTVAVPTLLAQVAPGAWSAPAEWAPRIVRNHVGTRCGVWRLATD